MIKATHQTARLPGERTYKLAGHTLQLASAREVLCPDGRRRTASLTGYDPVHGLHRASVQIKKRRVAGYMQDANTINATFLLELPRRRDPLAWPLIILIR